MGKRVLEWVLEYIHEVHERGFVIRVWASTTAFSVTERAEQLYQIKRICFEAQPAVEAFAEDLAVLPFCNAVEVKHGNQGVLIYPEWP